ncbi:hypothetical protein CVT25_002398 [Psilocybe cyanescens]|uniref:CCHC-type domain-containing protein n=1 Tax=Psilocybe cyanescens TaxID=93625 RepID=A0A409WKA5_PSICY|nr:hypothetical protein CVT25_002398 [Psilocybe cyanescens]
MNQTKKPPETVAKQKLPEIRATTRQNQERIDKDAAIARRRAQETESPPPPSTQYMDDGKDRPVNNITEAREFLESGLIFVPAGASPTPHSMASALFQVAELKGLTVTAKRAVRSVAYMMEQMVTEVIAGQAREVAVEQAEYVTLEMKNMAEHLKTTIAEEVTKQIATISESITKTQETLSNNQVHTTTQQTAPTSTRYSDAIRSQGGPPRNQTDPRLVAREGIRTRQFLLDFPDGSVVHKISQTELLRLYNAGIATLDDGEGGLVKHRIRTVERLTNKGLLGEFLTDEGAKWFKESKNADRLLLSLGENGAGAQRRVRTYNLIAYYVPVDFETDNRKHIDEMLETNGLHIDDLERVRWAKPIARRNKERRQNFAHLILVMRNTNKANKIICNGLVIHSKRVEVRKSKKEPIRCLKCQEYNHIARECINTFDTCGNCANRTHKTETCTSQNKKCVSCGDRGDGHTSWDRNCPTFHRKCQQFDSTHPENAIPFFPDDEQWTWTNEFQPPTIRHKQAYEPTEEEQEKRKQRQADEDLRPMRQTLLNYRPRAKSTAQTQTSQPRSTPAPTPTTITTTTQHPLPKRPENSTNEPKMTQEEVNRLQQMLATAVAQIAQQEQDETELQNGTPPPTHNA